MRAFFILKGQEHNVIPEWNIVSARKGMNMGEEKIINDKVDELLKRMEGYYNEAIEAHKPIQESLDVEVRTLMDEFDERAETKRYQEVKDLSDYIALTLTMPLDDELKERVVEEIVEECGKNGTEANKSV